MTENLDKPYQEPLPKDLPPPLHRPKHETENVYELNGKALLPGFLYKVDADWTFVPDIDGVVIDATAYLKQYTSASRRIYNLPGTFIRK